MKKAFKNIQTVIIVVLLIIIIFLRECQSNQSNSPLTEPDTIVKIETRYDTIVEIIETYIPEYRTKIKYKTVHDTIEVHDTIPVDTASILEDYFATYAYTDTLKKDSVTFVINDTISQNKILSRGINYSLAYPTTIISKESVTNKRELYVGLGLGGDKHQISYIGSELMLINKKKQIYGIGLGINSSFEPILTFKMGWKVSIPKLKKPKTTIPIKVDQQLNE